MTALRLMPLLALLAFTVHCGHIADGGDGPGNRFSGAGGSDGASGTGEGGGALGTCGFVAIPVIEVGSLELPFESWTDGDPITIVLGAEGGMSLSFELKAVGTPPLAELDVHLTMNDDTVLSDETTEVDLLCHDSEYMLADGVTVNVLASGDPFDILGAPVTLEVVARFADEPGLELTSTIVGEVTF